MLKLKMDSAARAWGKDGSESRTKPRMIVARDEADAMHSSNDQGLEEAPPVDFGLRERVATAEDRALAALANATAIKTAQSTTRPPSRIFS